MPFALHDSNQTSLHFYVRSTVTMHITAFDTDLVQTIIYLLIKTKLEISV